MKRNYFFILVCVSLTASTLFSMEPKGQGGNGKGGAIRSNAVVRTARNLFRLPVRRSLAAFDFLLVEECTTQDAELDKQLKNDNLESFLKSENPTSANKFVIEVEEKENTVVQYNMNLAKK